MTGFTRLAAALAVGACALASTTSAHAGPRSIGASAVVESTVSYATGQDETMRLFTPAAPANKTNHGLPAVLFIHGGAWERADAFQSEYDEGRAIAETTGWIVAVPSYPTDIVEYRKTEPREIHAALVALRQQPEVDQHRVAMWGESAGGNLALLNAYRHPRDVDAVVSISGPTDMTVAYGEIVQTALGAIARYEGMDPVTAAAEGSARYLTTSPDDLVDAASPPTFQAGSAGDLLVPPVQLQLLRRRLAAIHDAHKTVIVPGLVHVPENVLVPGTGEAVISEAIVFLQRHGM